MAVASLFEDLLDQYKLEQVIAEKRYTSLYQAYDVDDDRLVRVDILRAEYAEDSSFAGRFVNRARALAQVRHPNIAPVLHIGKAAGGAPYVAQAAIDGYPLSLRLEQLAQRNTRVNPIYALKLVRQLADALVLAERLEIFHYDLQPDNVLLKNVALPQDDAVILIDLFIPSTKRPRTALPAGENEVAYQSPEQRAGKEITAASHIYSLGVLLYRLLVGKLPPNAVTLRHSSVDRLLGRPTMLERERDDLTQATYQLVDRSLRKDPGRRHASMDSFVAALDKALAAEEIRLAAGFQSTTDRERRAYGWLLPALILALFLTVGAVASRGWRDRGGASILPAAQLATLSLSLPMEQPPTAEQVTSTSTSSPAIATGSGGPAPTDEVANEPTTEIAALSPSSPSPEPSPTVTPSMTPEPTLTLGATPIVEPTPFVRVMHNMVNLRAGPGVVFPLVGSVSGGQRLEVIAWNDDESNPWFLVITADQRIGWIAATVVHMDDSLALAEIPIAATLPATPAPTSTPQPTPTGTPTIATVQPTADSDSGSGDGSPEPPDSPTAQPTIPPPDEPTRTPPPPVP